MYSQDDATLQLSVPLHRVRGEAIVETTDVVARERALTLWVNGAKAITFSCSPAEEEALILGYLKNEGRIGSREDVVRIHIEGDMAQVRLAMKRKEAQPEKAAPLFSEPLVRPADLQAIFSDMQTHMGLFEATGGVHSGALYQEGRLVAFATDVARHNVLDKLCGKMLLADRTPRGLVLAFTGRQAAEIVRKAAAMEVAVLAGISAPSSAGITLADRAGLTLIGFVRPGRLNIYTHPDRVDLRCGLTKKETPPHTPSVITITARSSGVGKTTLIEGLLPEFTARGLRVGVFKRSSHPFSSGGDMKDTDRYRKAGAVAVFFESPEDQVILQSPGETDLFREAAHRQDLDLLILESRRGREGRVYEVVRGQIGAIPEGQPLEGVDAVITDVPSSFAGQNTLPLNDPGACAQGILRDLGLAGG